MVEEKDIWSDPNIWGDFDRAWETAKKEIFRLQLLDTYRVPGEEEEFERYLKGERVIPSKDFEDWKKQIAESKNKGVRVVNLLVVDEPPSNYIRFSIDTYLMETEKSGQETLIVKREDASPFTKSAIDFWMFDSMTVVPMKYDRVGHFLGTGKTVTEGPELKEYAKLRDALMDRAISLGKFIKQDNADRVTQKKKSTP